VEWTFLDDRVSPVKTRATLEKFAPVLYVSFSTFELDARGRESSPTLQRVGVFQILTATPVSP
jgi:hypothetical protein